MKIPALAAVAVALIASLPAARSRFLPPSGERLARASIVHERGSLTVEYRTLYYGQQTMNDIQASDRSREFYNRSLPGRIRGRLETEFELEVGNRRLEPGLHSFSLVILAEGGYGVRFGEAEQAGGEGEVIPLELGEAPWLFTNLACMPFSDGKDSVGLAFFYGEMAALLEFSPAAEDDE